MDESDAYGCDVPIRQYSYSSSYSTRWKVEKTSSGAFRIAAGTGGELGFSLAVGSYALNINGIDIEQRAYTNDSDYQDEWHFVRLGDDVGILGITNEGHDHQSGFNFLMKNSYALNGNSVDVLFSDSVPTSQCLNLIQKSKIFASRSHGGINETNTWLQLFDKGNEYRLFSSNIYNWNPQRAIVDFSGVDLILYIGCNTAGEIGKNTTQTLPAASVVREQAHQ